MRIYPRESEIELLRDAELGCRSALEAENIASGNDWSNTWTRMCVTTPAVNTKSVEEIETYVDILVRRAARFVISREEIE